MFELVAGIQIARRVTEERVAHDAEMPRSGRRRARRFSSRAMLLLRRSLHLRRERRPTSAVGSADSC